MSGLFITSDVHSAELGSCDSERGSKNISNIDEVNRVDVKNAEGISIFDGVQLIDVDTATVRISASNEDAENPMLVGKLSY